MKISEAQKLAKEFSERNGWSDIPDVDKFDHLHEELIEMSQYLRYKTKAQRIKFVNENQEIFKDGIGDLLFGTCRLANQLGVDMEEAFKMASQDIIEKYNGKNREWNIIK